MQHHICQLCGRDFHRKRLLRWHQRKYCQTAVVDDPTAATGAQDLVDLAPPALAEVSAVELDPNVLSAAAPQPPSANDAAADRRSVLAQIRQRVDEFRRAARASAATAEPGEQFLDRHQRRRNAVYPAPVPRYQPPFPTKEEMDRVKRVLFTDDD